MGRAPCCEKQGLKKGQWTAEEDEVLVQYIKKHGHGSWRSLPKLAGLLRCGKSCRLRWTNYLRPDIKRGAFTPEEEKTIIQLHGILGNRWSSIAAQLPGRTDNEIKNLWNTHLKKRLLKMGLDPTTHAPRGPTSISTPEQSSSSETTVMRHMAQWENARLEAEARLSKESLLFSNQTSTYNKESGSDPGLGPTPDYFLRIWKSDVGESFRRINPNCSSSGKRSGSQISSASSSPKYGSALRTESTNTWIEETQVITNLDLGQEPGSHPSKTNIEVKEEKEDQEEEEEGTSLPSNELNDTTGSFTSLLVSDLLVDFPQNIGEPGGFGETQQHVWAWADIKF